jgi:acyl-CoA thioesterase FadM
MGLAAHTAFAAEDHKIVTAELNVRYRKPAPIETVLTVRGHLNRIAGSNLFFTGEIMDAKGEVLTEADARWRRLK